MDLWLPLLFITLLENMIIIGLGNKVREYKLEELEKLNGRNFLKFQQSARERI